MYKAGHIMTLHVVCLLFNMLKHASVLFKCEKKNTSTLKMFRFQHYFHYKQQNVLIRVFWVGTNSLHYMCITYLYRYINKTLKSLYSTRDSHASLYMYTYACVMDKCTVV